MALHDQTGPRKVYPIRPDVEQVRLLDYAYLGCTFALDPHNIQLIPTQNNVFEGTFLFLVEALSERAIGDFLTRELFSRTTEKRYGGVFALFPWKGQSINEIRGIL